MASHHVSAFDLQRWETKKRISKFLFNLFEQYECYLITACVCIRACAHCLLCTWSGWITKTDEAAANERDYNDDHDLAHTAKKITNSKIRNDTVPEHNGTDSKLLPPPPPVSWISRWRCWCWCYPLCVQRPPVQLSVATATPSHSRPPCLGSGAVHSLLRCLSQSELHTDHSLHSPQPPSTERIRYRC